MYSKASDMSAQEILTLVQQAEAKQEESPSEARKLFLSAAQEALKMASTLTDKREKQEWLEKALEWKNLAQRLSQEREEESPKETSESSSQELSCGEDFWEEGRRHYREGNFSEGRPLFLQAARHWFLEAQKQESRREKEKLFQKALRAKELADLAREDLPQQVLTLLRESWEQEDLGQLCLEEGERESGRVHFLKGAERLLRAAELEGAPSWCVSRAMELKKLADAQKKEKDKNWAKTSEERSQPMRAEFLLKRVEEYERRGLDARDEGNRKKAAFLLSKAAEYLEELIPLSSGKLREARRERAERLRALAEELDENLTSSPARQKQKESEGERGKRTFIPAEKPNIRFDDIAGLERVKEEVRRKMVLPFQFPEMAEKYGIKRGGGILLYGPPGTGKTMIAQAIATEIDAAFFTVRPSEILSKWVGEAEKNLHHLFETARSYERSIIFIDEIESLVPQRRSTSSNVMQRLVPQILAELEGFGTREKNPLLFLGATNEPWSLDPAVLRPGRFDEKIYVGLPDFPAVKRMLELFLTDKPLAEDVDLDQLAAQMVEKRFSGADIKNICLKAATEAFVASVDRGEEVLITMTDLENLVRNTRPSVSLEDLKRFEEYASQH